MRAMLRLAAKKCDVILPVSGALANTIVELGVPREKIADPLSSPSITHGWLEVPPLSLDTADKTLIFVGKLGRVKNVERLLEAFRILLDRLEGRIRPKLEIVGDGSQRASLERRCAELGLAAQVEFVGQVPRDQVLRHLASAWALVLPSLSEGSPKVVVEAMATGRPVVASTVGGIPELVEDGLTGYLFDPHDAEDIALKLERLLSDDAKAIEMGIAGRERARAWDLPAFQRRFRELAAELTSRSRRKSGG